MPFKEPTPPEKIFTDEFAKSGEVQKVPNDLQADESLSWLGGFTKRFSRIPAKENGLNMIRQTFAGIVQPLSAKILQVEKDLRVRFLKTDKAKIENNDISFLETPQLTTQNLSANKAKIVDFTKELIKPSGKTIITDLTQNAGVISGIDTLSIADKAKSVNIILSPTTSQSVLKNTPPLDAKGKELVNAEWVEKNYGTAPSPYVHTFMGSKTTIPYYKIRGLRWVHYEREFYFETDGGCDYNSKTDYQFYNNNKGCDDNFRCVKDKGYYEINKYETSFDITFSVCGSDIDYGSYCDPHLSVSILFRRLNLIYNIIINDSTQIFNCIKTTLTFSENGEN